MTLNHTTPPDEWQCTREEGHTGPCSFKPRDSQTPESRDVVLIKQLMALPVREDSSAIVTVDLWAVADFITAATLAAYENGYDTRSLEADHELEDAQKALLTNYNAMFQELVNCYGYEKAKAIKEGIEAHES